jgi:hypothetical protein
MMKSHSENEEATSTSEKKSIWNSGSQENERHDRMSEMDRFKRKGARNAKAQRILDRMDRMNGIL